MTKRIIDIRQWFTILGHTVYHCWRLQGEWWDCTSGEWDETQRLACFRNDSDVSLRSSSRRNQSSRFSHHKSICVWLLTDRKIGSELIFTLRHLTVTRP